MKNYLLLLAMILLLCCCQETRLDSSKPKVQLTDDEMARLVLLDTGYAYTTEKGREIALDISSKFIDSKDGIKRTISNFITIPSLYSVTGKTSIKTDFSISKPKTPSLYVVNFTDNNGFVILSADKRAPEILATVGSGTIDSTAHIGLRIFLENSVKHIDEKVAETESFRGDAIYKSLLAKLHLDIDPSQSKPVKGGRVQQQMCIQNIVTIPYNTVISTKYIKFPLLSTLWDQGSPFNNGQPDGGCNNGGCTLNSKYPAGCVPIAEGQVVAYFYAKRNIGDWTAITAMQTGCDFTSNQSNEVSSLLHNIYLTYGLYVDRACRGTAAGFQVGSVAFTDPMGIQPGFGLVQGKWRSWNTWDIRSSLINSSPVVINGNLHLCGFIYYWGCGEGHEWVIDGMRDNVMTTTYQVSTTYTGGSGNNCPPNTVTYYTATGSITSTQIHQNWGWGLNKGSNANDWYGQGVFQSNATSSITGDINFNHANYIVAYITPY
jgi:hypothetical protein